MGQSNCIVEAKVHTKTIVYVSDTERFQFFIEEIEIGRIIYLPDADFRHKIHKESIILGSRRCPKVHEHNTWVVDVIIRCMKIIITILYVSVLQSCADPFPLRLPSNPIICLRL